MAWEIVYVDDGSTDGSYRELVRLHEAHANVRVVRLRRRFGKVAALAAGFEVAAGDVVVTIDADLQDDPAEIPNLLAKLDEGYDLVSGWKQDRRDPLSRRIVSRIYNRATALVTGVRLHDMNCGLKAYRAEVLKNVHHVPPHRPGAGPSSTAAIPPTAHTTIARSGRLRAKHGWRVVYASHGVEVLRKPNNP